MLKSRTLFVVGAGASAEAGLPTGHDLKSKIAQLLNIKFTDGYRQDSGDQRIMQSLWELAKQPDGQRGDVNAILAKARRIHDVMPITSLSIDNFLDTHRDDKELAICGKLGIVKAILEAEKDSKLKTSTTGFDHFNLSKLSGTWYIWLLKLLTTNLDRSELSSIFDNVTFVTFNYDRCIERFLKQGLSAHYNLNESEATALMVSFNIVHAYGQVGLLPTTFRGEGTSFGDTEHSNLLVLARGIKTFTEQMDDNILKERLDHALSWAETVVFLGFSFAEENLKLLSTGHPMAVKRCIGTNYGMSEPATQVINQELARLFGCSSVGGQHFVSSRLYPNSCNDTLDHFFRPLSSPVPT